MGDHDREAVLRVLQEAHGAGRLDAEELDEAMGPGVTVVLDLHQVMAGNDIDQAARGDGYVVAQEYLPEAKNGDVRMFVMNGQPLEVDGRIAAFRRRSSDSDMRSNMSDGGKAEAVEVNVFSPGGLGSCEALYDIDFSPAAIADLERKVNMRAHYGAQLPNKALNTI
nr:DUF1707 domain-containing protein [uncultured Tessaracoccus sp.]